MNQRTYKPTGSGKHRELRKNRISYSSNPSNDANTNTSPVTKLEQLKQNTNQLITTNRMHEKKASMLEPVKKSLQQNNLGSDLLEKIKALLDSLQTEDATKYVDAFKKGANKVLKTLPIKEAVNKLTKDMNLSDLLKSLGENKNTPELLQSMMNNPEMRQTAMDMMQEMMKDEKKVAEITEMMSKMFNSDKDS
ncbi:hypothetical protein [Ornithinibacillus scapharcae]|uniref:hypothetical protein n=1 Tax=Ornithinibacillus scapharcae TaxID=1147159 RepID=UPI000225ADDE|nr:hypothetical protein [Ornithinibacillus scapharcae]